MKSKNQKENQTRTWLDVLSFIFLGDSSGLSYTFSFALGIVILLLGSALAIFSALNLHFIKVSSGVMLVVVGLLICRKALHKRQKQQ